MVDLDEEVSVDDLTYASHQLMQMHKRIANIKTDVYSKDDFSSPHKISPEDIKEHSRTAAPNVVISDCQICVELAAKTILKSFGINPVQSHDINFEHERVTALLGRLPEDHEEEFDKTVPRVIFLTQFWERFYTLAKYGVPEENIHSFQLMSRSDAIRAIQDADFCLNVADSVFKYVLEQKDLERNDLDLEFFV